VDSAARFSEFQHPELKPRTLPDAVQLAVWTRHQREAQREGLAYLYFFPQGFTEKAQLYVRQGDSTWTLVVAPLTGKTTVVGEELEIPR
jgi:general secretion pathway protein H